MHESSKRGSAIITENLLLKNSHGVFQFSGEPELWLVTG